MESVRRIPEFDEAGIRTQSFAGLLISDTPGAVKEKLIGWGVADHHAIFCRAIGLNALFATPPDANILGQDFLRCYHRYTDGAYRCAIWRETPHRTIGPANFSFALYASGEYSKILELQWAEE